MTPQQRKHDDDLLRRDFICELGETLILAGNTINTASASGRYDLLELAVLQARNILLEIIDESKILNVESSSHV
jgi:hypothetical protein